MSHEQLPCPYCGAECEADWVDIGVGYRQSGPYYCQRCGASEIGPYDKPRELTAAERRTGWYAPGQPLGSTVNAIGGVPVDHQTARRFYEMFGEVPREAASNTPPLTPVPPPADGGSECDD